ncbi:MAG: DUF2442 domain-containing protein [Candidatus Competibacteraceae bacterium]
MKRPRLKTVRALPNYRLRLEFVDSSAFEVDKRESVSSNPGLAPLRESATLAGVIVADGGWTVEWPTFDIQIGVDTLWLDALAQHSRNEAQREFLRWRLRHGLSPTDAGAALGLTARTVSVYGTGARPVPKTVLLACKGWEAENNRTRTTTTG